MCPLFTVFHCSSVEGEVMFDSKIQFDIESSLLPPILLPGTTLDHFVLTCNFSVGSHCMYFFFTISPSHCFPLDSFPILTSKQFYN